MYWDANNLYGWAMGYNYLPYGGFKWLSKKEIKKFNLNNIKENSEIGYILQVDLEYSKELHDVHNDYPLCPEHISVNYGILSNYCKDIVDKFNIKVGNVKKLIYYLQPRPQSNFKKLVLAPHDFAGNFYLI